MSLNSDPVRESLPPEVLASLGYYVYCLRDPRSGEVFYVGKGRGARAFAHQYGVANVGDTSDPAAVRRAKNARIAEIHASGTTVQHVFIRIEVDEATAFIVEQAVIDAFRAEGNQLTNVVLGHRSHDLGLQTVEDLLVRAAPKAPPLPSGAILIKITQWRPHMTADEERDQTRHWWPIDRRKRGKVKHLFGVVDGVIRTCYDVESWTAERRDWRDNGKARERVEFTVTDSPLARDYLLTNVRDLIGASQWPVRFPKT